jgi:hypothetical protein
MNATITKVVRYKKQLCFRKIKHPNEGIKALFGRAPAPDFP